MKKILSFILAIILCFGCFSVAGFAAFTKGVLTYEINSDGEAFVTACNKNASGIVVVPSVVSINGGTYSVVGINDIAFENCVNIKEIITKHQTITAIITAGEKATETLASHFDSQIPKVGESVKINFNGKELTHYRAPSSSRAYPLALNKKAEAYARIFIAEGYDISQNNM